MSSSRIAAQRPRSSMSAVGTSAGEASANQPMVDMEFRRKHARQNKEIIMDNVAHKLSIKVLRDEITSLKEELLEVKRANWKLSGRINELQRKRSTPESRAGLAALDMLLSSMPALQHLRDDLCATTDPMSPVPYETTRANLLRNMGISIATKPGAAGGRLRGLDTLGEEEIEAPDGLAGAVDQRPRPRLLSRESPMAKPAARSLAPLDLRPPPPTLTIDSPTSSASPSPRKRVVPSPKRKPRRRRESGLMPASSSSSRSPNRLGIPSEPAEPDIGVSQSQGVRDLQENELNNPEDASEMGSTPAELAISSSEPSPSLTALDSLSASASSSSASPLPPLSPATAAAIAHAQAEDDGRRGRRARGSINYKEPSLTKKMRKPDGVAAADMMRARQSTSSLDPSPEMALARPGMRRKSVLPKSIGKLASSSPLTSASDDDADDIDDCLLAVPDNESVPPAPHLVEPIGNDEAEASSSTLSTATPHLTPSSNPSEVERTATPIPPVKATPESVQLQTSERTSVNAEPLRISPRKPSLPAGRRPSALATKTLPPRIITPTARARAALTAVPEPNLPSKPVKSAMATAKKRVPSAPTAKWK